MTKSELIKKVQQRIGGYPARDVAVAVHTIFAGMVEALKRGERIEIRDFGNITVRDRTVPRREGNSTSRKRTLPKRRVAFFKVGRGLYHMINGRKES